MRIVHLLLAVIVGVPVALLDAAPVPKDFRETTETYEWKGEKRTRTVRKLKCGKTEMEFVKVPKGSFMMGSNKAKDKTSKEDETPAHKVTFTQEIWVARYPVTKGQFAAFAEARVYQSDSQFLKLGGWGYDRQGFFTRNQDYDWKETGWEQSDHHPVVNVTWQDTAVFCDWMNTENKLKSGYLQKEGKWDLADYQKPVGIRLLTEAEYEYANRGGTNTTYMTGDTLASLEGYANVPDRNSKRRFPIYPHTADFNDGELFTSPVGKYKPNGFGLYDMTGNVQSWCADWYDEETYAGRKSGVTDPEVSRTDIQTRRVIRGSSWHWSALNSAAARREPCDPK